MKLTFTLLIGSMLIAHFAQAESIEVIHTKKGRVQLPDLMCVVRKTPDGIKYQAAIAAEAVLKVDELETNPDGKRGRLRQLNILYSELMDDCSILEKIDYAAARRFGFVETLTEIKQNTSQSHRPECTYTRIEAYVTLGVLGPFDSGEDQIPSIKVQGAGSVLHCKE